MSVVNEVAEAPGRTGRADVPAPAATAPATFYALESGDTYWRVQAPARAVGAEVRLMSVREANAAVQAPNRGRKLPWSLIADLPDGTSVTVDTARKWTEFTREPRKLVGLKAVFPEHEGAAVFTRPDPARAALAKAMREDGVWTVAECDDNYFAPGRFNIALRQIDRREDNTDFHARSMASMDANVFSTPWLRDRYLREYRQRFGRKGLPELFVCRNNVARGDWPERVERDGQLRVGFMGSDSHVWDINLAYPAFANAANAGCETWMVGYNPGKAEDDLPQITADGVTVSQRLPKAQHNLDTWAKVVHKHRGWVPSTEFRRAALPLDIGLCPLRADDFTLAKSDVKMVEYTISGAASVAMNNPVYNSTGWKDSVNCLLAGSAAEMAEATMRLVKDPRMRYELVTAAQEYVASERNETVMANEWKEALRL